MNLRRIQSQEAGLKYFVLGAFASGFYYMESFTIRSYQSTSFSNQKFHSRSRTNKYLLTCSSSFNNSWPGIQSTAVPFHFGHQMSIKGTNSFVAFMASAVKAAGLWQS